MSGRVACVVPAFDAATQLPAVVAATRAAVPTATVIVIDDGSRDGTKAIARELADVSISWSANRGKGVALRAGFREALALGVSAVVTLDADGQHDPAFVPKLLDALGRADVAVGARTRTPGGMPWGRRVTNALSSAAFSALSGATLLDTQCGFRALRAAVLRAVQGRGDRYEYESDLLLRAIGAGFRVESVPISTVYGPPSHFRPLADGARIVRTLWAHRSGRGE
ncbi:MAG: glycosyltransferase family 2 protein [Gemmatimonadaceae bacterium]